jgi:hypothetical protein
MKKQNISDTIPRFHEGHIVTGIVTVVSGLISALALAYHIHRDAVIEAEAVKWAFVVLSGAFAFGMAMTPMSLARAHGESIEGGSAQSAILGIVILVMIVDGALQVHAAAFLMELLGYKDAPLWALGLIAGAFQIAMFFIRGALYQASTEIKSLIEARQERIEQAAAYAREQLNAKRREQYAERNNVVNMR